MILYKSPVFGPVKSRRFGNSLGVNLNPEAHKNCTFDCLYCECGFNPHWGFSNTPDHQIPSAETVIAAVSKTVEEHRLKGDPIDCITFAGNGEPTLHPQFPEIVDAITKLGPSVNVLTNGTEVHRPEVREALAKVTMPCVKFDSFNEYLYTSLNRPCPTYSADRSFQALLQNPLPNLVVQTMFCDWLAEDSGKWINNYTGECLAEWSSRIEQLKPSELHIYTIARETPYTQMRKCAAETLDSIASEMSLKGFSVKVSY